MTRGTDTTDNCRPDLVSLPPICILVGGRGTRLGDLTVATPKPLLEVAGRPFIEHVLAKLRTFGAESVVLSTGYLADSFVDCLGDGTRFGLHISYVPDGDQPSGTGGGVRNCLPLLGDRFIVLYGDSFLRADPHEVLHAHARGGHKATMAVLAADSSPEPPNCVVSGDAVISYGKNPRPVGATHIDYGMLAFERTAFDGFDGSDLCDLQSTLAEQGEVTACVVLDPYTEIGTPDALSAAEDALS